MTALLLFLFGAMSISFLCSILEASLMSTPISYVTMREEEGYKPASRFKGGVVTDPVYVESCWRARNGRYLNLRLRVMTGDDEVAQSTRHVFGCVNDTLVTQADSTTTLHLSLYHSQGGQPEYYSREVYLSIPLYDVSADSVRLTVQTYNGLLQKTLATK